MANFKSAAAATRTSWPWARTMPCARKTEMMKRNSWNHVRQIVLPQVTSHQSLNFLHSQDHYFGGFNQRGRTFPRLQAHLLCGFRGDDRCNVLLPDGQPDLRQQPAKFHFQHASDELVAAADLTQIATPGLDAAALELFGKQAVDLALRYAMVSTGGLHGLDFSVVDPLLQGGIADAQNIRRFARRQELLHDRPPASKQNTSMRVAIAIRFYTIC